MNEITDQLIQVRFDALADQADARNWSDVLARAALPRDASVRRRRVAVRFALATAALVLAAAVVAFVWPGAIVDFFEAPPAPESVAQFFQNFNEEVPQGGPSDATVGEAREVMTATFDTRSLTGMNPTEHTLYVATRSDGGFCFIWTDGGGGCADPFDASADPPAGPVGPGARFGVVSYEADYATAVNGYVRGGAQTVEARFADGTSATLPITWVSAPIDAGFFAYAVPPAHLTMSDALTSVVALDADGNVVERQNTSVTKPLDHGGPHHP